MIDRACGHITTVYLIIGHAAASAGCATPRLLQGSHTRERMLKPMHAHAHAQLSHD